METLETKHMTIAPESGKEAYSELYRPQFHFSPRRNWMNDPNGLIKFNDTYHLYFQYNPYGNQWGHMSWGHATSEDLVHWKEQPVAIPEKEHMIYSGTAVVDSDGSTLTAAFTSCDYYLDENDVVQVKEQHQSVAKSIDGGFRFEELKENPVLKIGSKEFRDPKLFYDDRTGLWNMLVSLATEHKVVFYQSDNLREWNEISQFGPLGNTDAIWECPDFFELKLQGMDKTKWVLTISAGHAQEGFLGMQYFIGEFDGYQFTPDDLPYPLYLDCGKDFYAGITFANTGQKEYATMMAWLGCHLYSRDTPTEVWRGAMSLPRELYIRTTENGQRLASVPPYSYLEAISSRPWEREKLSLFNGSLEPSFKSKSFSAHLRIKAIGAKSAGLKVLKSRGYETAIGIDFTNNSVFVDRTISSSKIFNDKFPSRDEVLLEALPDEIILDVFVDHSIIEVFIQDGQYTITSLVFPEEDANVIKVFSEGGTTDFEKIEIRTVKSIWK